MNEYREQLRHITSAMARIHKTLLESEIENREIDQKMILSPADRWNLLLNDPDFEWLRALSQLMAAVDEVYFQKEVIEAEQFETACKNIIELLILPSETKFSKKYRSLLPVVPDLMPQHGLLKQALK